jgi:hypothetical protein
LLYESDASFSIKETDEETVEAKVIIPVMVLHPVSHDKRMGSSRLRSRLFVCFSQWLILECIYFLIYELPPNLREVSLNQSSSTVSYGKPLGKKHLCRDVQFVGKQFVELQGEWHAFVE